MVPSVDVAALLNVGAVPLTVELLVTEVLLKSATSLPELSWIALVSFPEVGSVYATVTASSFFIVVPTVRVTSLPETLTVLTLLLDPAVVTAKSLVDGTLLESRL